MNHEIKDHRLTHESPTPLKWALWIALLWLFAIIQASFLSHLPIFGATVELTLALVLLFSWRQNPVVGGIYGMIGGFLLDALVGTGLSVLPLLFFAMGVYAAFTARRLHDHPLTYLIMTIPAHLVLGAWRGLCEKSVGHVFAVLLAGLIGSVIVYIPTAVKYFRKKS
jgi:hypothetical protein